MKQLTQTNKLHQDNNNKNTRKNKFKRKKFERFLSIQQKMQNRERNKLNEYKNQS